MFKHRYCGDENFGGGHVLSNCTFSKLFSPGVRLGWIEGPERIVNRLKACNTAESGGCFNHYMSVVMTTAIKHGLISAHLQNIRKIYEAKITTLCKSMKKFLPEGCSYTIPQGGFFVWMKLPGNLNGNELLEVAKDKFKVDFIPGEWTSASGKFKDHVRLSISFCKLEDIEEGVKRLGRAIEECLQK